jgi:hypothetical protein
MRGFMLIDLLSDSKPGPVAGVRTSASSSKRTISNRIDQHYEQIRIDVQPLLEELGIAA